MPYYQFFIMIIVNIGFSKRVQMNSFSFLYQLHVKVLTRKKSSDLYKPIFIVFWGTDEIRHVQGDMAIDSFLGY